MTANIRRAETSDAPAIASILNAFITTTTYEWTEIPRSVDGVREWLDEHEVVFVADEGGEVVGVAAYGWFRDAVKRPGYRFTVENTVHVREDYWRSGVGALLMRALIDEAARTGKHVMIAAIDASNEVSIRFHERLGFVEAARMPEVGEKFGRWCDLVLLELRLDERNVPGLN
jgi:L-amino acid N-acyltransferase